MRAQPLKARSEPANLKHINQVLNVIEPKRDLGGCKGFRRVKRVVVELCIRENGLAAGWSGGPAGL
jgi:hypothetical protein